MQKLVKAKKCRYVINFETNLIFNQNVGNDWALNFYYENREVKNGDVLESTLDKPINIKMVVVENDTIPDIAEKVFSISPHDSLNTIAIEVEENRGRYFGNKAKWEMFAN